jgi:hypothetical protein
MPRLRHYRFGLEIATGHKLRITLHFWRWTRVWWV